MKTINATLKAGLLLDALIPALRLDFGAVIITIGDILNYHLKEHGRLGGADIVLDIDNSAGTYSALAHLTPHTSFSSEEGLTIAGTAYYQTRGTWYVKRASNSSFGAVAQTIHIEARNTWDIFSLVAQANLAYIGSSIGEIVDEISGNYGITTARDAGVMWGHKLNDFTVAQRLSGQIPLGVLMGDGDTAYCRAYGRFESDGTWTLKSFLTGASLAAAPAADASIGSAGTPAIYDAQWQVNQIPTHISVRGFDAGTVPVKMSDVETAQGTTDWRIVNCQRLLVGGLVHRQRQEVVELRELQHTLRLRIQPDLRLQLWDVLAIYNVGGVSDGTVYHITGIEFVYHTSSAGTADEIAGTTKNRFERDRLEMWLNLRQCASTSASTAVTSFDEIDYDPNPFADTLQDDFDRYGGTEVAQSGSTNLRWLSLARFDGTDTNLTSLFNAAADTAHYIEGAAAFKLHDGGGLAVVNPAGGNMDFTLDNRFTADDYLCLSVYLTAPLGVGEFMVITVDAASPANTGDWTLNVTTGWNYLALKRSTLADIVGVFNWAQIVDFLINLTGATVGPVWIDDLRLVKADPDNAATYNDTGRNWDFSGGEWHIYGDVTDIPYALGNIKHDGAAPRYTAMRSGAYFAINHFACGVVMREAGFAGMLAFAQDASTNYEVKLDTAANTVKLIKWIGGASTLLGTATKTIDPNVKYMVGLMREGNFLSVYVSAQADTHTIFTGPALLLHISDSSLMGGKIGVVTYGTMARFYQVRAGSPEHAMTAEFAYNADRLDGHDASEFALMVANNILSGLTTFSNTTDAISAAVAAVVLAGGLGVAKTLWVGAPTAGATIQIDATAANAGQVVFDSVGLARWVIRKDGTAESGGDVGSDLVILSRTDTGAAKTTVITIKRSSGLVTFANDVTITGDLTLSASDLITDTTTGTKIGTGSTQKIGFFGATPLVQQTADIIAGLNGLGLFSGASLKLSGIHHSNSITYISGTGTAGADNTAQTIKTLTLAANTLTQVGDRIRVRAYWAGTTGAALTGSIKLGPAASEVLISNTTDSGAATLQLNEAWLHYIDNTHANIIENEAGGLGALSAANVAGFTWASSQAIIFTQDAAANNHAVLYALIVDVFPKGV